jgi:carboxypeptidase family protein
MRSLVFGMIAMSSASACAGDAPGEIQMVADVPASGIEGQVTIRPVRPVERQGTPNARPYQAKITVLDASGREISVVESDAEGRFRVPLPPGTYVLRPESPGRYPRASEQRVVVRDHALTHVSIVYDSGIR